MSRSNGVSPSTLRHFRNRKRALEIVDTIEAEIMEQHNSLKERARRAAQKAGRIARNWVLPLSLGFGAGATATAPYCQSAAAKAEAEAVQVSAVYRSSESGVRHVAE